MANQLHDSYAPFFAGTNNGNQTKITIPMDIKSQLHQHPAGIGLSNATSISKGKDHRMNIPFLSSINFTYATHTFGAKSSIVLGTTNAFFFFFIDTIHTNTIEFSTQGIPFMTIDTNWFFVQLRFEHYMSCSTTNFINQVNQNPLELQIHVNTTKRLKAP